MNKRKVTVEKAAIGGKSDNILFASLIWVFVSTSQNPPLSVMSRCTVVSCYVETFSKVQLFNRYRVSFIMTFRQSSPLTRYQTYAVYWR